jgi:phosphohistidine phosphatase
MPGAIELYLVRHAIAAERGDQFPDDSKRPLTDEGAERFRRVVQGLAALDVVIDLILTSPFVRTRQTAELLSAGLANRPSVQSLESLAPGHAPTTVLEDLAKHSRRSRLALVGHEPDLGQLAARLIGTRRPIEFKKGAVCRIDVDGLPVSGPGHLHWFAPPRILRRLSR